MMQVSYSGIEKYETCPRLYKLHYLDRLRPTTISSPLFYGSYFGEAVQNYCLNKKDNLTPEERKLARNDPYDYFDMLMADVEINGEKHYLPDCDKVIYFKGDYDELVLTDGDKKAISKKANELGMVLHDGTRLKFDDFINEYFTTKDTDIIKYMNFHFYLSMLRKGHMMIDSFLKNIYPNIIKVHAIEKPIKIDLSLETDEPLTDYLIGYIDIIMDYKITDPKLAASLGVEIGTIQTVLFDFKTSSTRYQAKKLTESVQLNLYDYVQQNKQLGYIVAVKKIKRPKIGPEKGTEFADIQVMIGESNLDLQEKILDNCCEVLEKIQAGEFPKNEKTCGRIFGKACQYINYCRDGSMVGLIKKEKV